MKTISYCLWICLKGEIFLGGKKDNWKALRSSFCALGHWFFRLCNVLHGEIVPRTFIHISDSGAYSTHCKPSTPRDSVYLVVFVWPRSILETKCFTCEGPLSGFPAIPCTCVRKPVSGILAQNLSGDTLVPALSFRTHISLWWCPEVLSHLCGHRKHELGIQQVLHGYWNGVESGISKSEPNRVWVVWLYQPWKAGSGGRTSSGRRRKGENSFVVVVFPISGTGGPKHEREEISFIYRLWRSVSLPHPKLWGFVPGQTSGPCLVSVTKCFSFDHTSRLPCFLLGSQMGCSVGLGAPSSIIGARPSHRNSSPVKPKSWALPPISSWCLFVRFSVSIRQPTRI